MADTSLQCVMQHIRTLAVPPGSEAGPDGRLLQRFTSHRDESAFAGLVRRHGPMVLGVCRSVLGQAQDAEDVFQATFFLLARKAEAIRGQDSVAGWLYQVAYRLSLKSRAGAARRRQREAQAPDREPDRPADDLTWRELRHVLHEEVNRLPEKYRSPLVLHYLEGLTQEETARRLGLPRGTLKGHLERARALLRQRLSRRGLAPGVSLLALVLSSRHAAALPPGLAQSTTHAVLSWLAHGPKAMSAGVAALLPRAALAGMKAKLSAALLFAACLAVTAAGSLLGNSGRSREGAPPAGPEKAAKRVPQAGPKPKAQQPADQSMLITGRVLGADGKPVARARVALMVRPKRPTLNDQDQVLGQARADAQGRFRLEVPLTPGQAFWGMNLLAGAPGHGLGYQQLSPDVRRTETTVKLPREQVLRGRLVDLQGQPAANVKVFLIEMGHGKNGQPGGVHLPHPPKDFPLWPGPVTTDAQGRFVLRGLDLSDVAIMQVRDRRFAVQEFNPGAVARGPQKELRLSLAPAQLLEGRVLEEDTGKPIPNAQISAGGGDSELRARMSGEHVRARADAQGRFRISLPPGSWYKVAASPGPGSPYLSLSQVFAWPKGAVRKTLDIRLPRGVLVRGKVTEKASGKPVAGAGIQFIPRKVPDNVLTGWQAMVTSGADGSFQIAVPAGTGHLVVSGPTQDFIHLEVTGNIIYNGEPGGLRLYPDGLVKLTLAPKSDPREVVISLRRGVTVKGRLLGPDGKPVAHALMFHRLHVAGFDLFWRFPVEVSDGRFEVHGCDPGKSYPVYFLDPENQWGATVQISGKQAGGPVTVRLAPCGRATVRVLDQGGSPIKDFQVNPVMVITPGAPRTYSLPSDPKAIFADEDLLANLDRRHYWGGPRTDDQGRCTLPALIPGASYYIVSRGADNKVNRKVFTVKPGQTLSLGDITTQKSN